MDVRSIMVFTDYSYTIRYLARFTGYIKTVQCPRFLYNNKIFNLIYNVALLFYIFEFLFMIDLQQVR